MTGLWRLVRIRVRTGWLTLALCLATHTALVYATVVGLGDYYPEGPKRDIYIATVGTSYASRLFNGRGYDLASLGGIFVYEWGFLGLSVLPVLGLWLAVRQTRAEEDSGRADLVTAAPVGRLAPLASSMVVLGMFALLIGAGTAAALAAGDLPWRGSLRYGLVTALHLLAYVGLGWLCAQLAQTARGALGLGAGIAAVLYLTRALIDVRGWDARWATPSSWMVEARPYGEVHWEAFWLLGGLAVVLVGTAGLLAAVRDLSAGVVAPRPGPARAGRLAGTPLGFVLRSAGRGFAGWFIGALAGGALVGTGSEEMIEMFRENPQLAETMGGTPDSAGRVLVAAAMLLYVLVATAFVLSETVRVAGEESAGRTGLLLSTPINRLGWWVAETVASLAGGVVLLLVAGLAHGVMEWLVTDNRGAVWRTFTAVATQVPALLVVGVVAVLLRALHPRLAALGWLLFCWVLVVGFLAEPLDLPRWARDLSPVELIGKVPLERADWTAFWWLLLGVGLALALAGTRWQTRDLAAG